MSLINSFTNLPQFFWSTNWPMSTKLSYLSYNKCIFSSLKRNSSFRMLLPYQSPTGKVLWDSLSVILFRLYLIYSSGNCFEICSFLHNKKLQNLPQFFQKSNSSQSLSLIHPQFFHKLTNELRYCIHLSKNIFEWSRFGQLRNPARYTLSLDMCVYVSDCHSVSNLFSTIFCRYIVLYR